MFKPETVLVRKDDPTDRLRVIGPSPVGVLSEAEWGGMSGEALVVTDADDFAPNVAIPVVYLTTHFNVESVPPEPEPLQFTQPTTSRQAKPEEVFAAQAAAERKIVSDPMAAARAAKAAKRAATKEQA